MHISQALWAARFAPPRQIFRFIRVRRLQPETRFFLFELIFSEAKEEKRGDASVINNTVPIFFRALGNVSAADQQERSDQFSAS